MDVKATILKPPSLLQEFASILGDIPVIKIIETLVLDAYEGGKFPEPYRSELKVS